MNIYNKFKSVCIISDNFIPQKLSAAGMIFNLSRQLADQNIEVTCIFSGSIKKSTKNFYDCKTQSKYFERYKSTEEMLKHIKLKDFNTTNILIKGSRVIGLEALISV